ncbi:tetratricopeptide repeat protein [Paraburkholderia flava]|uniref:O-linked N-acetylglucosamine transferase family protein n=1 Tax=Paraburkholderia flava TaxID=2547393 RepID=UPI001F0F0F00|nr:tetratricopeptide repeat protein [Paraburkholderia flava]
MSTIPSTDPGVSAPPESIETGLAHQHAGRFAEAAAIYREILRAQPNHADALHLLGLVAYHEGRLEEAVEWIMRAIGVSPNAMFYGNLGNALGGLDRHAAAAECYRQALALKPDYVHAHNNLGNTLRAQGQYDAAVQSFRRVIELQPDYAQAYNNLANALVDLGDLDGAIAYYRKTIELQPDFAEPHSNLLFILSYREATSSAEYLDEALRFGDRVAALAQPFTDWPAFTETTEANANTRPLRVGFVSGDLKTHPVGHFLESILAHLDPRRIAAIAYPTRRDEDELTVRIKPCFAAWTSLAGLTDEAAARRIRDDRIDVLVDLSGHTVHNRLPVFAWRPAPVQVSWLGYFASTGLRAIDYVLADRHVVPDSEETQFVERIWRLPDSYLCFTPPVQQADIGPLPMQTNGTVTFGCFNHLMKMNDTVVDAWARILHAVPGSRLFLKAKQLDNALARETTLQRFATLGIDNSRLTLEGRSPRGEYLDSYNRVDIALSPFPYPGGTVSVEGLWMGVPVLCRRGDRFLSHLCESLLQSAGLEDWIATDTDDYIAKAIAFAANPSRLMTLRKNLRTQIAASPLCDAPRFAKHLEAAFTEMYRARVASAAQKPAMPLKPARVPNAQTIRRMLDDALKHHQAGRLAEAHALYQQILAVLPKHADALHFSGLLACQIGEYSAGIALIRESIAASPSPSAIYANNLGNMLRENGALPDAIDSYRRAVALKRDYAEAHNNLGNALREAGDAAAAMESCATAISLRPGYAEAYNNLGNALKDLEQLEAAALSYGKAIEARPDYAEAHNNLGNVLRKQGHLDAAIECYRASIAAAPTLAVAHNSLGSALSERGEYRAAIDCFATVAALQPERVDAHNTLGNALNGQGRLDEAVAAYECAIAADPQFPDAYHNLANALRRMGRAQQALALSRKAIALKDDVPSFHNNLGTILADLNEFDAAVESYRKALALDPDYAESHTCVLFGQSYASGWSAEQHLRDARYFGERMTALARPHVHRRDANDLASAVRPLRIGFVSADLRKHPVGYFLESVLAHLDRSRIVPVAYSNAFLHDELTARLQPRFAGWRNIVDVDDETVAKQIRDDRIDILVDLSGHTGRNRLPVFAWKPAPVQVSWLGYFATTGIAEMDYVLADRHVLPPGEENQYVEQLWRLPDSYLCFTLPEREVEIGPLPAFAHGGITFGNLNNQKKLNDRVIAVWSRILHALPGSRLLLKNHQLNEPWTRQSTLERFAAHGIATERLLLEGPSPRDEYFATFNRVDLALDPFPYPGGTTSVEGLWMGVPVLGRRGDRFLSHLGETVLQTAGLSDWIADSDDDYVAKAIAFASDLPKLAALRAGLRAQLLASPLCDARRYARNLEDVFAQMWARWLDA